MPRLLPLIAALVLFAAPAAQAGHPSWDVAEVSSFDRAVLQTWLDGWTGAGRACFDAAGDLDSMAACLPEAEADEPVGAALIAYHAGLYAALAQDWPGLVTWLEVAIAAPEGEVDPQDPLWTVLAGSLGSAYLLTDRNEEARARWAQAVDGGRAHLAAFPDELGMAVLHLAVAELFTNRIQEAVPHCIEALADADAEFVRNEFGLRCMALVGGIASQQGDWHLAAAWWTQFLAVADGGVLPRDHADRRTIAGNLARAHYEQGQLEPALALWLEIDPQQRAAPTEHDPRGLMYSYWIAEVLMALGRFDEAEPRFAEYVDYVEQSGAHSPHQLVHLLTQHADCLQRMGSYDAAEARIARGLGIARPLDYHAILLNNLGQLLRETGRSEQALPVYDELAALQGRLFGAESAEAATGLYGRANCLSDLGRLSEAKLAYERVLAVYRARYGEEHLFVGSALTSLASLLHRIGDTTRALPLYERAVVVYEATAGPNTRFLGTALNNLAQAKWSAGEAQEAHDLYWRSFEVLSVALGPDHPDVTAVRTNYAELLGGVGMYAESRDLLADCLAASERRHGPDHVATARLRADLADSLFYTGQMDESALAYTEALGVLAKTLGPRHPTLARHRSELSMTYAALGRMEEARAEAVAALELTEATVHPLLAVTSERERLALIRSLRGLLDRQISLLDGAQDAETNYAAMLGWKGIVAQSLTEQRAALRAGDDPELLADLTQLDTIRRQLASLVFGDDGGDPQRVGTLTAQKEAIEQRLAQRSATFRSRREAARVKPRALCRKLGKDEALVDVLRYHRLLRGADGQLSGSEDSYLAMVSLGGACERPIRVELGAAEALEVGIVRYRRRVGSGAAASALAGRSKSLRAALWDPIEAVIGGRTRVWIVPDGAVSSMPFGALLHDDGRYLLETHDLGLLASAQELLRTPEPGRGALVAGGILYDAEGVSVDAGTAVATRSAPRGGMDAFGYLPETKGEAEAIAARLGGDVTLLLGAEASESRLRRDLPGKRRIHLATHGFFASGQANGLDGAAGLNPMLLSGVVLAGANAGGGGAGDDGILTAEEVVGLDLRGAELVVLSACETALGAIEEGEGVLGLSRAFALAGAQSLVLSLWKVPDAETRRLMEAFYRALEDHPPAQALRIAQRGLLAELRDEGRDGHPFYWAAFVLSGR